MPPVSLISVCHDVEMRAADQGLERPDERVLAKRSPVSELDPNEIAIPPDHRALSGCAKVVER